MCSNFVIISNMPKVKNPLFSLSASGDLGATIQYVCGKFVRMKPKGKPPRTSSQEVIRNSFFVGANKWKVELSWDTKKKWFGFSKMLRQQDECVEASVLMNGYNLWMSYWLKAGEGGWNNYPNPPVS